MTREFQLKGIHHVTAITNDAVRNYHFITEVLGMRLVKKTVNQDDIHTYHTFFADDRGSAGTDLTFFDFPNTPQGISGTNEISRIGLRVPSDAALDYYLKRFEDFGVDHGGIEEVYGRKTLAFKEADGQDYRLFSDEHDQGVPAGQAWLEGPVPKEFAINGLGPVEITVSYYDQFKEYMQTIYGFRISEESDSQALLEVGPGGNGGSMILIGDNQSGHGLQGYGEVHHVSFRVNDHEAIKVWEAKYNQLGIQHSGWVDRFYFEALYARVGHILIEISTDGPGFATDEPYETMGESLSLPPFLEGRRQEIEAAIKPFNTKRH